MQKVTAINMTNLELEREVSLASNREKALSEKLTNTNVELREALSSVSSLTSSLESMKIANENLNHTITDNVNVMERFVPLSLSSVSSSSLLFLLSLLALKIKSSY